MSRTTDIQFYTMNNSDIPIGIVEGETGLNKEILRKWELRYGFPSPVRNKNGIRTYSAEQVRRLRTVKLLVDSGMRPSQAVSLNETEINRLLTALKAPQREEPADDVLIEALRMLSGDLPDALLRYLSQELMRRGVQKMVLDVIEPLTREVGNAWADGRLGVHHEHHYVETVQDLLRGSQSGFPRDGSGLRIVLATPPTELHTLGLLMLQTLLNLNGARSISFGSQLPASELADAARIHRATVVGVSFSIAYPQRLIHPYLQDLRNKLPAPVRLWVGGAGAERCKRLPDGVQPIGSLTAALAELNHLQESVSSANLLSQ